MNLPNEFLLPVTQEDIDHGDISDLGHCPVALAVRGRFPNTSPVYMGYCTLNLGAESYYSEDTSEWISRLIRNEQVEPRCFLFKKIGDPSDPSLRAAVKDVIKKRTSFSIYAE